MKPTERCVLDLVAAFVNSHSQISVVNGREFCITYIECISRRAKVSRYI